MMLVLINLINQQASRHAVARSAVTEAFALGWRESGCIGP